MAATIPPAEKSPLHSNHDTRSVWPRITMVTPVRNCKKYLDDTIRSILSQGYPNLEYVIVDGNSTDGTVDVIRRYENQISRWISETDNGMYDAINKGFARSTGEVMGWLNAGDMLHTGGLQVVGGVFQDLPSVDWITGIPTGYSDAGATVIVSGLRRWSRFRFLAGANRYIMQEATFWRRNLWDKAGGYVDDSGRCGVVSDFELWIRFFRHAHLYPVQGLIGGYRNHPDSLGLQRIEECHRIQDDVVDAELEQLSLGRPLKLLCGLGNRMRKVRGLRYA